MYVSVAKEGNSNGFDSNSDETIFNHDMEKTDVLFSSR